MGQWRRREDKPSLENDFVKDVFFSYPRLERECEQTIHSLKNNTPLETVERESRNGSLFAFSLITLFCFLFLYFVTVSSSISAIYFFSGRRKKNRLRKLGTKFAADSQRVQRNVGGVLSGLDLEETNRPMAAGGRQVPDRKTTS